MAKLRSHPKVLSPTRRRRAVIRGGVPASQAHRYFEKGDPAPEPPVLSDLERAVVNLASNTDWQDFLKWVDSRFVNRLVDRSSPTADREIWVGQGRAELGAELKAALKSARDKLEHYRRQQRRWHAAQQ